jgi:probable O-glycosylation ligase (exosortase A-associated)
MRDVFIIMMVLATIPMIYLRPHVGILAWCWISYMNPHRLAWGFAYSFPVAMAIGVATLTAWMISKEPKRLQMNAVSGLLLAVIFWMSFANLFAIIPDFAFVKWEQSFKILLMTVVTMVLMQSRERIYAFVWVIVASMAFFGVKGGIFTILSGGGSHVWGPPKTFIEDNNALAMATLMTLPLVWFLYQHTAHKLLRWGLLGTLVTMAFSIIGSQSRGAFLAAIAVIGFLIVKSRHRAAFSLMAFAFLCVGVFFVPQSWIDRMETIEHYDEDVSALGRLEVWEFAFKLALDRPIVGGGFRAFADDKTYLYYIPDAMLHGGRNYHSVYFEVLGELGFVGLAIFLGLLLASWRAGTWIIRRTNNNPDFLWANDLARMTQVSLVAFACAGAFQNLAFFDLYYHLVAILFLTQQVVLRDLPETANLPGRFASVAPGPGPGRRPRPATPGAARIGDQSPS